jgi:hypothetical protein
MRSPFAQRVSVSVVYVSLLLSLAPQPAGAQSSPAGADKSPGDVREEKAKGEEPTDDDDDKEDQSLRPVATVDVVRAGLEPAYVAYPFGLSGLDRLIFESNIVAHFVMHLPDWPVAFVLTPKVLVRMFYEDSAPVKSPSYMPRIAAYFWFDNEVQRSQAAFYGSITLSHHSNGQTQSFFQDDGNIRHDGGDFSTNFFEFSLYTTGLSGRWFGWSALSLQWHPGFNQNPELRGRYGLTRINLATTLLAQLPWQGEIALHVSAILDDFMKTGESSFMRAIERFPISLRYIIQPPHTDIGLYIGYFLGHDYYNIYFDRIIHTLQVGISGSVTPTLSSEP